MSSHNPPPTVARAITQPIADDLPCRRCQYNLRGLESTSLCPECGAPVALSIKGDLIRYSDPKWIVRLAWGADWALWAVILFCAWVGFIMWNRSRGMFPPVTPPILLLGVELITARAVWLLTTADPSGLSEDQYSLARKIARVSVVFQLALQIWNVCAFQLPLPPGAYLAQAIGKSCVGVIGWIGFVARVHYISKLAARIPDQRTTSRARNLRYSFGIPMGLNALLRSSDDLASAFGIRTLRTNVPLEAILGLSALCIFIFGIPYLLMLTRLGDLLRAQHALAERSWDAALSNDNPLPPV